MSLRWCMRSLVRGHDGQRCRCLVFAVDLVVVSLALMPVAVTYLVPLDLIVSLLATVLAAYPAVAAVVVVVLVAFVALADLPTSLVKHYRLGSLFHFGLAPALAAAAAVQDQLEYQSYMFHVV